jgi:hypothetical protein
VEPAGHPQAPAAQLWPAPQVLPQAPQLATLVWVSTHAPLQLTVPPVQPPRMHTPPAQTVPRMHGLAQPPQLLASACTSTHAPPHEVSPLLQAQAPVVQV